MKRVRVLFVSLAIFSLILPASGFAAFQGPTDFQGKYEPSQDAIQLRWQNVESYSRQTLTKTGSPSGERGVLKDQPNPATGQQTFSDTNQGQPFANGVYTYQLQTVQSGETQTSTADVSVSFEDSNIVIVRTSPSGQPPGYIFFCRTPTSDTSIQLSWVGSGEGAPTLKLYTGPSESGIRGGSRTLLAPPPTLAVSGGTFSHNGLVADEKRYYWLEADYVDQPDKFFPDDPISCTTLPSIPQDPALLNVTPLGPTSLYVTWKDNAVRPHNFVLERIKVTPATSTNVSGTRSGSSVRLTWTNPTNVQTFRSPYYHVVERSADSNFTTIVSFPLAFPDDMRYTGTKETYDFTDTNAPSGTTYYRVKACSLFRVDYRNAQGNLVPDGTLDEVCTAPTPTAGGVATVTPSEVHPASVVEVVRNIVIRAAERIGNFFSRLTGQVGAVGFATVADGAQVDLNAYFDQFRLDGRTASQAVRDRLAISVYRDDGLEPDTVYLYRTKTVYTDAGGGETSYTNEGAGKTLTSDAATIVNVNVCVRNNLCGPVSGLSGGSGNAPVNQCTRNADCRNVGTLRQFFQETPR